MVNASWKAELRTVDNRNDAGALKNTMRESQFSAEELVARELIQNSKDASQAKGLIQDPDHHFRINFQFRTFGVEDTKRIRKALNFKQLNSHLELGKEEGLRSLTSSSIDLNSESMLNVLTVNDYGAGGLGGKLNRLTRSAYYRAMLSFGVKHKESPVAGGSKGFGKSAFIQGSKIGTVFAFSKFLDDSGHMGFHFGGVSYQYGYRTGKSESDWEEHTGLSTFGDQDDPAGQLLNPLNGKAALKFAEVLGLDMRQEEGVNQFGTSLVLLYPDISPDHLVAAIENHWWPALSTHELDVQVMNGELDLPINPDRDRKITNFMELHRLLKGGRTKSAMEDTHTFNPTSDTQILEIMKREFDTPKTKKKLDIGSLAMKFDQDLAFASSTQEADPGYKPKSEVALVRSTGMVIEIIDVPHQADPVVQGVFLCSPDIEPLLRALEPPAHNYWWPSKKRKESRDHFEREAPAVASFAFKLEKNIEDQIRTFKRNFNATSEVKTRRLRDLSRHLGAIFRSRGLGGTGGGGPSEKIAIHNKNYARRDSDQGSQIRHEVSFDLRLDSSVADDQVEGQVTLKIPLMEAGGSKGDAVSFAWEEIPDGFMEGERPGELVGSLRKSYSHFCAVTKGFERGSVEPEITVNFPGAVARVESEETTNE